MPLQSQELHAAVLGRVVPTLVRMAIETEEFSQADLLPGEMMEIAERRGDLVEGEQMTGDPGVVKDPERGEPVKEGTAREDSW